MKSSRVGIILKISLSLLASVLIFIFVVWKFISTDTFGNYLSLYINKVIKQYTEVSIRYDKISAKLFPLGIRIENLEVKSLKPLGDVSYLRAKVKQLDVDAKIFTLTFDKLQISNIELTDIELETNIILDKKSKNDKSFNIEKIWNYETLINLLSYGKVEVFRVALNKAQFLSNLVNARLEKISWEKYKNAIECEFLLKSVELKPTSWKENVPFFTKYGNNMPMIDIAQSKWLIEKKKISIIKTHLNVEGSDFQAKGTLKDPFNLKSATYLGNGKATLVQINQKRFELEKINSMLRSIGINSLKSNHEIKFEGNIKTHNITGVSKIDEIDSKYGVFNNITSDWHINNEEFEISSIQVNDKLRGVARTANANIRIDLKNKKLLNFATEVDVEKLDISNALIIVPAVSKALRGQATGKLIVNFDKSDQSIKISSAKGARVHNFKVTTFTGKELLGVDTLVLNESVFAIGELFTFAGEMLVANNQVVFEGAINKDTIKVKTNEFILNFDEIKNIAGISTEGKGSVIIDVDGDTKNPKLKFALKNIKHANVFGFYLGELSGNVIVDFVRDAIFLEKMQSTLNPGRLKGDGYISLTDFSTDIAIYVKDLSTFDVLSIHKRLIPWNLSFLEKGISTTSIEYKISGKINELRDLQVKANINMQRFTLGSEEIYDVKSSLLFKDKILAMPDISFRKGKGHINIGFSVDFNEDVFRLAFKSKNLEASDLLLYSYIKPSFNSHMQLEGAYKSTKVSSEGVFNIIATQSHLNDEPIDDSYVAIQWKDEVAKVQGKYGANWIKLNAQLDLKQNIYDASNRSFITCSVNVPNWGKILSLFASFDNDDPVLSGNLNLELDSLFNYNRWKYADIDFWVKSLNLNHPSLQIQKTSHDRVIIQNGEIKKWDLQIKGLGRDQLITRAFGHIAKNAEIESVLDFSLGKLNYFLGTYLDLNGFLQSQLKVRISPDKLMYLGRVKSEDAIFNSKNLVTTLGKTKLLLEFDNKETRLVQWQSQIGAGTLNINGNINWTDTLYPATTFRYNLQNAKLQMATRSMTTLNGQGVLVGTQPPYIINGDIKLSQTEILNEPGDFNFTQESKQGSVRHLPVQQKQAKSDLFIFNIQINTESPIVIRNSIAELNLLSNLQLQGKISDPRLTGQVTMKSDRKNIFILKNNQFKLNRIKIATYG